MLHRPIYDEVMSRAARRANGCHPSVAERYANELARYARLTSACDALESFMGCRPLADEDVFSTLALRRSQIADLLAQAKKPSSRRQSQGFTLLFLNSCAALTNSLCGF